MAIIRVGGASEVEVNEKKDRVDDALLAARGAGYPREHDDLPLLRRAGWQENTAAVWERR